MFFYLIGIKGSGMSSLAGLLQDDNYEVRGYDVTKEIYTQKELIKRHIIIDDDLSYLNKNNDLLAIVGHSFISKCKEYLSKMQIPYLEYNEFIDFYLNHNKLVSIAGSHGKTTLTSMLSQGYEYCSFLSGDSTSRKNEDEDFIFLESCEYQNHYLKYHPRFIIITNIDYDHIDYFKTKDDYYNSFKEFADKANVGLVEYNASKIIANPYFFSFGINPNADFYAKDYKIDKNGIKGKLYFQGHYLTSFSFHQMFGLPLLMDVIATLAFYYLQNIDLEVVKRNLLKFKMSKKRFNITKINNHILIDDYAHHPQQIEENFKTIETLKNNRKTIAVFKPDRVSRFIYFKKEIINALENFDMSFILDFPDKSNADLLKFNNSKVIYLENEKEIIKYLNKEDNYIVIFMSSKNLNNIEEVVKSHLKES